MKKKTTTTAVPTTKKGNYHKVDITEVINKHDDNKHKVTKKPLIDKKPAPLSTPTDKTVSFDSLNSTIYKISDNIENRVNAIKEYVDQSIVDINKIGDDVYQNVGNKTSKVFEIISEKLERLEAQLQKLKFGSVKSIDDDENKDDDDDDDDDTENLPRFLFEKKPNVVDSEVGKKFRSLEALDAEMRMDLKNSINDAMSKAQEKFNRLIEEQVSKVNRKINEVNEKFEAVYRKIKNAIGKIAEKNVAIKKKLKTYTPPTYKPTTSIPKTTESEKYTTIHWKPKSTTWAPPTPDYYKYTAPPKYQFRSDSDTADDRIDKKIEDIERIDKVKDELKSMVDGDDIEKVVDIIKDTLKYDDDDSDNSTEKNAKIGNESDDDVEIVTDSIKAIEIIPTTADDKSNENVVDVEKALAEELRNEMENKLPASVVDEIDNLRDGNDDDIDVDDDDDDVGVDADVQEEVESSVVEEQERGDEGSDETERDNFDNEEIPIDMPTSVDEEGKE
jgi:hypothetical protein